MAVVRLTGHATVGARWPDVSILDPLPGAVHGIGPYTIAVHRQPSIPGSRNL